MSSSGQKQREGSSHDTLSAPAATVDAVGQTEALFPAWLALLEHMG